LSRRLRFSPRTLCNPQAASMTASETPSLVLRKTSLTMRARFTPAKSCSTWTRMCANLRLLRFSAFVSSPRGGFFFRLAGSLHGRLVALESGILVQGGPRRIGDPFLIGYLLVMPLARVRLAEVVNPLPAGVDNDHVLVAMLLLASAVKKGLFFETLASRVTRFTIATSVVEGFQAVSACTGALFPTQVQR